MISVHYLFCCNVSLPSSSTRRNAPQQLLHSSYPGNSCTPQYEPHFSSTAERLTISTFFIRTQINNLDLSHVHDLDWCLLARDRDLVRDLRLRFLSLDRDRFFSRDRERFLSLDFDLRLSLDRERFRSRDRLRDLFLSRDLDRFLSTTLDSDR